MTDDDQGWIEQSRRGDQEAFASLVRRYQRMIHSLTYRMTGSLAEAEDLAQDRCRHRQRRAVHEVDHGDAEEHRQDPPAPLPEERGHRQPAGRRRVPAAIRW